MAQPSKRSALTTLTRVRLLELADLFELELPRAAAKGELIEALAHSKRASFGKLLDALKREELKDICRAHGLDDGGREKSAIRDRILGTASDDAPATPSAPPSDPTLAPIAQLSMLAPGLAPPARRTPAEAAPPSPPPDPTQPRRPSERSVLAPLTRDRLADLARVLGVAHAARATRDALIEAIVRTARPSLAALLSEFTRDELRATCRAHGLDASDRARGPLVDRLLVARGEEPTATTTASEPTHGIPRPGDIVRCRHRSYLVEDIVPPPFHREATLVKMVCLDDDAPGRALAVLWELELGAEVLRPEAGALGNFRRLDDPRHFAAYFHAIKWNSVTATEASLFQAPFRAGIALAAYQLIPLMKALELPRANLFIADDVGLGKTIEAGLVLQELLLRQRVEYTLIVCPASVCLQWQDEMKRRFGLQFEIYDRAFVARRRRQRGFTVNPWATHNRFIISYPLLRRPEYLEPLTAQLGARGRKKTLLILDEAHTVAPASPTASSRYAVDSKITTTIRDGIAPHFENRLFLSATPHNGHSNSFSALLEILDPQRFTRGVKVEAGGAQLRNVMVRRLKRDIRELVDRKQFPLPERRVLELTLARDGDRWHASDDERTSPRDIGGGPPLELELADLLAQYTDLVGATSKRQRLVFINLQKRLLSSIPAFLRTLGKHAQSFDLSLAPGLIAAAAQQPLELSDEEVDPGDDLLDAEDDDAVTTGSRELATPVGRARELLERMAARAAEGRGLPDARVLALVEWIRVHMCPAVGFDPPPRGSQTTWNDRRVLVFTESIDTQRYLRQMLLSAFRATDPSDDRILELHGGMPEDARAEVQLAFNGDPAQYPVRVLLATDAAREGVNLQGHCADLFHFDIPWNPARMEQRNGRIDRTLQPAEVVRCHYFRYRDRPADQVLATVVRKVETIQKELGSLGAVIHGRVADLLTSEGIGAGTLARIDLATQPGERAEQVRSELETIRTADFQALKRDVNRAVKVLGHSRELLNFNPELLRDTIDVALERLGHGRLAAVPELADAWRLPALPDTWAETLDTLRSPRARDESPWDWRRRCPPQPVVFEAPRALTVPQVHLHLHHPFVRRILDGFLAQGFGAHELQRITVVRDPKAGEVRVLALGRLSLFGRGAARLHDALIPVVAPWDSDTGPQFGASDPTRDTQAVLDLETLLARPASLRPISALRQKDILARAAADFTALWQHVRDEANERASEAEAKLRRRGELEASQLRQILSDQRQAIERTLAEDNQLGLAGVLPELERQQFTDDRDHMRGRLDAIRRELESEPADLQSLYEIRLRRLEPVGLVYLWPEMMA